MLKCKNNSSRSCKCSRLLISVMYNILYECLKWFKECMTAEELTKFDF